MKFLKMLTLAVFAMALAGAAMGPTQAGATVLCVGEAEGVCPEVDEYPANTKVTGSLAEGTEAEISNSIGTIKCSGSTIEAETSEAEAELLAGSVTGLSFTGCSLKSTACTLTAEHLPFAASWQWTESGDGFLTVSAGEKGVPAIKESCGSLIKCTLSSEKLGLDFTGGEPGSIVASAEALSKTEGFLCPKTSSFTATYTLSAPESGYVFLSRIANGLTRLCKTAPSLLEFLTCGSGEFYEGVTKSELDTGTAGTFTSGAETITCDKIKVFGDFTRNGPPLNNVNGGITTLNIKGSGASNYCTSNLGGETPDVFVEMLNTPYNRAAIVFRDVAAPQGELVVSSLNGPVLMKLLVELAAGQKFCEYEKDELIFKIKNASTEITRLEINGSWRKRNNSAAVCPAMLTQSAKLNFKRTSDTGGGELYIANVEHP